MSDNHPPPQQQRSPQHPQHPSLPYIPERSGSLLTGSARPDRPHSASHSPLSRTSTPPQPNSLHPLVATALSRADTAVGLDNEGRYQPALQAYNETVLMFERIMEKADATQLRNKGIGGSGIGEERGPGLSEVDRKRIIAMRNAYIRRAETLNGFLGGAGRTCAPTTTFPSSPPPAAAAASSNPSTRAASYTHHRHSVLARTYEQVFDELTANTTLTAPRPSPQRHNNKAFTLLTALLDSMTTTTTTSSVPISDVVLIPPQLWVAPSHKLPSIETKIAACETVAAILRPISESTSAVTTPISATPSTHSNAQDPRILLRDLTTAVHNLEQLRSTLVKKHKFFASADSTPVNSPTTSASSLTFSNHNLPTGSSSHFTTTAATTSSAAADNRHNHHRVKHWSSKITKGMEKLTSRPSLQHLDQQHSAHATLVAPPQSASANSSAISLHLHHQPALSLDTLATHPQPTHHSTSATPSASIPAALNPPPPTPTTPTPAPHHHPTTTTSPTAYRDALVRVLATVTPLASLHQHLINNPSTTTAAPMSDSTRILLIDAAETLAQNVAAILYTGFLKRDLQSLAARFWKKMRRVALA
ncbi:hypothetical protein DFJ77DRAFT_468474 [Powellomyces hirtus]|nr:hypothetical protein DFJ77DRAFT_468474 [Powellomyces hirtus]